MNAQVIAYCGLICTECPSFIATKNNDMEALQKLADEWTAQFGQPITAEGCLCTGCLGDGQRIEYCSKCGVRLCAVERGVENCAHCYEFGCEKLTAFWENAPKAKTTLEEIRATLQQTDPDFTSQKKLNCTDQTS